MRIVAIIQARMSSQRLAGKVLAPVAGRPLLGHVIARVRQCKEMDEVTVATTCKPADDAVARYCSQEKIFCFRGSEEDVLDRYYRAALEANADAVTRITADCPLMDAQVVDATAARFRRGGLDYVSNTLKRSYPDGLDVEVFSFGALECAWREATLRSEREHVTPYIWKHPERFRLGNVRFSEDLSLLRWTVDEPADLEFVRQIYSQLNSPTDGMGEILETLRLCPELGVLNAGLVSNKGYAKSLREDEHVKEQNP